MGFDNGLGGRGSSGPSILLSVTADMSLLLMQGVPQDLTDRGWDVHVVTSPGPRLEDLTRDGVSTTALPMARDPAPAADLRSLVAWIRLLRRLRPDVVSAGTPKAGLLAMIAARLTRVPARVYIVRGLRLESVRGPGRFVLLALERMAASCATHVVAVSGSLREGLIETGIASAAKVVVVGAGSSNGVVIGPEPDEVDRDDPTSPFMVGFVGRPSPDKGLDLLLSACQSLANSGHVLGLTHVGGGLSARHQRDMDQLSSHGWDVRILGELTDVTPVYAQLDALCLPTKREGFPNVVLEAAQAGVPCIATRATGIPDAIVNGDTGIIVDNRDPQSLAAALLSLSDSPETARRMGRAARERAITLYARPVVWEKYAAFYDSLQAPSRRTRVLPNPRRA